MPVKPPSSGGPIRESTRPAGESNSSISTSSGRGQVVEFGGHLDKAKEDIIIQKVLDDYIWSSSYREQYANDWRRYYRMYRSKLPTDAVTYPFESNVFIPYVFSIIETQLPIILQELFSAGKFVEVIGKKFSDESNASIVRDILRYQFEHDIQAYRLAYLFAKQAMIYGSSPVICDWNYKQRKIRARVPKLLLDGTTVGLSSETLTKVIANNPISKVIDIFNYFQCPTTPESPATSENVLFAGYEFAVTYEELLAGMNTGLYNENVKKLRGVTPTRVSEAFENRLQTIGKLGTDNIAWSSKKRTHIPGIHYFGLTPNEKDELVYRLITLVFPNGLPMQGAPSVSEAVMIRNDENPFFFDRIPIIFLRVNHNVDELYGIGDIETIESLQLELNDQRNQRNDIIVRTMNPMFKKLRGTNIDDTQLQYRPCGTIDVDNMDDLKPLIENPTQLQNAFTEEAIIKRDIQFATGISDFVVGQFQNSSGFNDTATGISLIQAAAQGRIVLKTQWIQTAIKELAETIWALNQQFLPVDTVFKVLDPASAARYKYIRTTPEVISGQYDFSIVNAPSIGNSTIRRQQVIQISQAIVNMIPQAQASGQKINIDFGNLIRRILEEFDIPNITEIFPDLLRRQLINIDIPDSVDAMMAGGQELSADEENALIEQGTKDLQIHPGDDDIEHIISHMEAKNLSQANVQLEYEKHISLHQRQVQNKKANMESNILSDAFINRQEPPPEELSSTSPQPTGIEETESVAQGGLVDQYAENIRTAGI